MRLALCVLSILFTQGAFADGKLPFFKAGRYALVEGPAAKCGNGQANWLDPQTLAIGPHPFYVINKREAIPSDIPQEKGCNYDVSNSVDKFDDHSQLLSTETVRCPTGTRHVLSRTATLKADQIVIEVKNEANAAFPDEKSEEYRCVFTPTNRPG